MMVDQALRHFEDDFEKCEDNVGDIHGEEENDDDHHHPIAVHDIVER